MRRPHPEPVAGLPERVTIYEVGPRDGLQHESPTLPAPDKAEFVRMLAETGLDTVEVAAFVPADRAERMPQIADAPEVLANLGAAGLGRHRPVLVPDAEGLERALACGVSAVAIPASATESYAQHLLGCSRAESLDRFVAVVARAKGEGAWVRAHLAMCLGDPWEGSVPLSQVVDATRRLLESGCDQISLGDTLGVATTGQVHRLLESLDAAGVGLEALAVHFHDTYGQGLANTLTAIRLGVTCVDASAGGLGGCPYARSATGNLATEDLLWALDGLGVRTGVDLKKLVATSAWLAGRLGRPAPSRVVAALQETV